MKNLATFPRKTAENYAVCLLICLAALTGCLSRPALKKQTFAFDVMPVVVNKTYSNGHILGIRKLQIAPPFEERSLVYRTGEFAFERDSYAEFLDLPADQLLTTMRAWWQSNGRFRAVVEPDSTLKPDFQVEINVNQLFGDFRQPEHPLAVMSLRFAFFDAPHGIPGNLVFQQEYTRRIPLPRSTATALVAGWNQALAEILSQVTSDLRPELGGKM